MTIHVTFEVNVKICGSWSYFYCFFYPNGGGVVCVCGEGVGVARSMLLDSN